MGCGDVCDSSGVRARFLRVGQNPCGFDNWILGLSEHKPTINGGAPKNVETTGVSTYASEEL